MTRKPIVRTALLLVPFQIVRAGEPLLPILLAAWFGSTAATDVYNLALAYFTFVGSLSFGVFRDSVLVPMLAEVRIREPELVPKVAGSFLAHTLVFGGALAVVVGLIALGWFRARYAASELAIAAQMVLPFCLFLVALSVKTFFVAMLNAHYRFFAHPIAAGLGVGSTIGVIALLRGSLGVVAIPLGSLAGELVAIAVLAFIAIRLMGMKFTLSLDRPEPVRRFVVLALPDVAGGAVTRVNPMVDQMMIAFTGVLGGGTLLKQAGDIGDFPTSVLQAALLPVLLTHFSDDFAEGRIDRFRATLLRALVVICGSLVVVSIALFALRGPVLRLAYLHGAMDPAAVDRLAQILPYYLVGLAPSGALLVLARAHIAIKNTKIMLPMGILNAALHVFFNILFVKAIGLEGLALSASCVNVAVAIVFWLQLETRLGSDATAPPELRDLFGHVELVRCPEARAAGHARVAPLKVPRVVHVVVAGEIGGAERMLLELASRPSMTSAEHTIALMTPNDDLARVLNGAGLRIVDRGRVHENPVAYVWRALGPLDAAWLEDTLRRERADIVHLHTFGSQVVGTRAALAMGAKIVRTEHSTRIYKDPTCWPFARWALARGDAVVAVSEHVRHIALAKAPWLAPKIRVLYSGVDTKRFSPPATPRAHNGFQDGSPFTFVIVGRLEPRKGIDIALHALAEVGGARFSVVGDGNERGRLEARARANGVADRVMFHGYVDDPRPAIASADAILCSSREEGLGIALLEAMAMGRPVVTVPVGGVPEIVKDGGTGWIAKEATASSLAGRMREAMRDPARVVAMGRAARVFVETTCSLEHMCEGYGEVYGELARS